ncbi:MAG: mechanosensitive ion channel [Proteobacteria bacterium]|nr:mechanosensitive ion channel [Pseudomonadota bacterium]MBU1714076.1 mechanosensitive ion channel [Pseudomonadota bacterium]
MELSEIINKLQIINEHIILKRLMIIFLYALLAKAVDLFIDRVLRRLASKTKISFDDHLISFIHTPICWTVFLLGILHALLLQEMQMPWQLVLPALTKSAILLVWLIAFLRVFHRQADKNLADILARGKIGNDLFYLLKNIVRVILVVACLLWVLSIWDVDLTPLFASAGIVGIAVALAAKDTLANFFGGISIFADNTFKVGDYIILDGTERGEVVEIGIRSTRIKTRDDVLITIPNSILANSKIINESAPLPRFRIRIPVSVAYGSDLSRVEDVLLKVAADNPNIITDPEPRVRLRSFGDSSVNFELLLWVEDPRVKGFETHNLLRQVYEKFNKEGIVIPFPQRDIHLKGTAE